MLLKQTKQNKLWSFPLAGLIAWYVPEGDAERKTYEDKIK